MRILLVGAGASFSIKDVETGYVNALRDAGADVKLYLLDQRLAIAQRWMHSLWRARGKPKDQRPTWPDVIYRAGVESLEMALRFDVDWVFAISAMYLHPDALELMKRAGLKTSVLFTESPYDDEQQALIASLVDVCWTNERASLPYLSQFNPRVGYLRHAFDPARHTPVAELTTDVPEHDVVFVGTGFQERIDLLSAVDLEGIDFGLYGTWTLLPPTHRLRKHLRGGMVDNEQAAALYRRAKVGLNLHRTSKGFGKNVEHITNAQSMNPRAYELAACGVPQISDYRDEVGETFDWTVPTFDSPDKLRYLIQTSLAYPAERQERAQQARQRVQPHTFAARAAQVLADLERVSQQPIRKGA